MLLSIYVRCDNCGEIHSIVVSTQKAAIQILKNGSEKDCPDCHTAELFHKKYGVKL